MSVLASYNGPWKGVDVSKPDILLDKSASPEIINFVLKNGEIRTRQRWSIKMPKLPDGYPIKALISFMDGNNVYHTCAISPVGLWQLNGSTTNLGWNLVANFQSTGTVADIYPVARFINKLYFCMGNNYIFSWDGISYSINVETAICGGLYLFELDARLVCAYTIEASNGVMQSFPQRIRWSASGYPGIFDPSLNVGAGFNDSLDCPDALTGILTVGRIAYIFRENGITELTPTGQGTNAFEFNHLWASDKGLGNVYRRSLASWGNIGIFVADDDIHLLTVNSMNAIGKTARDAIFSDIADASGDILGSINMKRTPKYVFPAYELYIPLANDGMVVWTYLIEEQCWMKPTYSRFKISGDLRYVPTL